MKKTFFICLLLFTFILSAQDHVKHTIELQNYLDTIGKNDLVPLLVKSNDDLNDIIKDQNGRTRMQIGNIYSIELPAQNVLKFITNPEVLQIDFSSAPAFLLSDSMRINNNIDSVQHISARFPSTHTGKGVLMGIIDSGIDFSHPDFKDSSGNTRIFHIWDQTVATNPSQAPQPYGYGVEWDSAAINAGLCTHIDPANSFGHGSMVAGAAAGNGLATGNYKGVAVNSNLIVVATDFNRPNWLQSIAESVDYIFKKADSLNVPCVINISAGTYSGSHDGKDIAAQIIDTLLKAKNGRAIVAAAGNAGNKKFHLGYNVQSDTNFTWFEHNVNMFGSGGIYFKLYADTSDFNNVYFGFGADKTGSSYSKRGHTSFSTVHNSINNLVIDTLKNSLGQTLAYIQTYAEEIDGVYSLEVGMLIPDSSQYKYRFSTYGNGRFDLWSSMELTGTSNMISDNLPSQQDFPDVIFYKSPDSLQTMVSSFTCLPSVLTVANYTNRISYLSATGAMYNANVIQGEISINSSLGPTRTNHLKPDIAAAGDIMLSASKISLMQQLINTEPLKISADSMHMRNGGTSMAAPGVAGILAMYLEKCSKASYIEMMDAIRLNAVQDQFTQVPSPQWGHGKVNAYKSLMSSNFIPIIAAPPQQLCVGDTTLIISSSHHSYLWSTNDTTQNIYPTKNGDYFVTAENFSGCKSRSDTFSLFFSPNPPQPLISQSADTLIASGTGLFQWYVNGSIISGANKKEHIYNQTGYYTVKVTYPLTGCSSYSDSLYIQTVSLEEEAKYNELKIYPNPTNGNFTILYNCSENVMVNMYDLSGKLIFNSEKKIIARQPFQMDLSHIPKGLYFISIEGDNGKIKQKLIIQ